MKIRSKRLRSKVVHKKYKKTYPLLKHKAFCTPLGRSLLSNGG